MRNIKIGQDDFCIAPFNNLFVKGNGDVSLCCNGGLTYANLHEADADMLLDSPSIEMLRQQSIDGTLKCIGCKFGHKYNNPKDLKDKELDIKHKRGRIAKIQFEIGYFCNSSCSFCSQPHATTGSIPLDKIKTLIKNENPKHIRLQGGEFIYNKGAEEFLIWLSENKNDAWVDMHTNCALPKDKLPIIFSAVDCIFPNIYGPSDDSFYFTTGMNLDRARSCLPLIKSHNEKNRNQNELKIKDSSYRANTIKFLMTPTNLPEAYKAFQFAKDFGYSEIKYVNDYAYDFSIIGKDIMNNIRNAVSRESKNHAINFEWPSSLGALSDDIADFADIGAIEARLHDIARQYSRNLSGDALCVVGASESAASAFLNASFDDYMTVLLDQLNRSSHIDSIFMPIFDINVHEIGAVIRMASRLDVKKINFSWSQSGLYITKKYSNEFFLRVFKDIQKAIAEDDIQTSGLSLRSNGFVVEESAVSPTRVVADPDWFSTLRRQVNASRERQYFGARVSRRSANAI